MAVNSGRIVYAAFTLRLDGNAAPQLSYRNHTFGGVAERLKAVVLKTTGPQGLAGSNPASSARRRERACRAARGGR